MQKVDLAPLVTAFYEFFTSIYKRKIDRMLSHYPQRRSLEVDFHELERFDPELADRLVKAPDMVLEAAEQSVRDMHLVLPAGDVFVPHVRVFNMPNYDLLIQDLGSKNLGELVAVKAVVTKRTEVMHKVKIAIYLCQICDARTRIPVTKSFTPPKRCESCKKFALKQLEEESSYVDVQRGEVQELLERVRGGAPGAHTEVWMEDDLVNTISPGDNVEIVGILRLRPPLRTRQRQELVYGRFIDVVHITSMKKDFEELEITPEEEQQILEFSHDSALDSKIASSIAPGIYGHEEVKRSLALQLFGGTKGKMLSTGVPLRDDIHVLLIGDPGLAKCVGGDSHVVLEDGSILKIQDVVEEELVKRGTQEDKEGGFYTISNHDILSMNTQAKMNTAKATVFWKVKPDSFVCEIQTSTGKSVTVTPEHPFFVSSNGQAAPKKAQDLKTGDFIATPHYLSVKTQIQKMPAHQRGKTNASQPLLPEYIEETFARFLGYLFGDGYVQRTSSYGIGLSNTDRDLLTDFSRILESYHLRSIERIDKRTGVHGVFTYSVELGKILEKLGATRDSFHKSIPLEIMKSPNAILKEFLKAYFDCEAHVSKDGIAVSSASQLMLKQIQILLLRFRIISQLHPNHSRATNAIGHKKTKYYRLVLCGENAKKFYSEIGFVSNRKRSGLNLIPVYSNTNIDVIPGLRHLLHQTRLGLGFTQFDMGIPRSTYQHYERGDRNPSYRSLSCICAVFAKRLSTKTGPSLVKNVQLLQALLHSDIFWDKVVKIKKKKSNGDWLYDLQVENYHNFVANGIIVHNTKFLQSVAEIAPKSIYVSGKTTSSAGLTVSAEKDELGEGGWTLKAGALVLASGGAALIDEFDKIDEEDRSSLHEGMESQQLSIAKAGIVAKFKSKTAILAAANPKFGRFDINKNLADQYDIPPTLLSRFDLIFPIIDVLDPERDMQLAEHILATHMGKKSVEETQRVDRDFLRKYIAYARRKILPKLSREAIDLIKQFYVDMRGRSKDAGAVAITPRYLEGLVRLAEANAKMRLSETVEGSDAQVAVDLMTYVMRQVMTDKVTGLFDVDTVATGKPKSERDRLQKVDTVLEIIKAQLRTNETAAVEDIVKEASEYGLDEATARRILSELLRKGEIYEKEHGYIKLVDRH